MTRHSNCCVHLGTNNFRNSPGLAFCRIAKARRIQREYVRLFRNANLKVNSDSTRICSAHWDGGDKQRTISSIFRWSKKKSEGRIICRTESTSNSRARERNTEIFCTEMDVVAGSVKEVSVEQVDRARHLKHQTFTDRLFPSVMLRRKLKLIEEFTRSIGIWIKSDWQEKGQAGKRKRRVDFRFKETSALKNPKFDNSKFNLRKRMKMSNFTLAIHTVIHLCFFTICYMTKQELELWLLCEQRH